MTLRVRSKCLFCILFHWAPEMLRTRSDVVLPVTLQGIVGSCRMAAIERELEDLRATV